MMKMCSKIVAIISILLAPVYSYAGIITFNGQAVNALDLNGQVDSFVEFYDYDHASANTGLEVVNRIIMFVAELNNEFAIFTIANKANADGTGGLFKAVIESTSGSVSFVDDDGALVAPNKVRFDYAPEFTDGYIYEITEQSFDFNQAISSVSGLIPAVGVDGIQFIDFTDGGFDSATYSELLTAQGNFNVNRVAGAVAQVSAPTTMALFSLLAITLFRRKP